ncbi:hypothetical protein F511_13034 [Dorcoceras hygrometricum]|uniref:Dystroglycan-like n=1 Tax=Dorcoceras hygrometricum TaxID=472368 RepID=A0A2Z7AAW8_9LAMI|nr:hypothetical protein F511_13034 [Dorcoceras hygrometricum]
MASSSFTNAYLVDFESVLEIPDQEGMQKIFKALENSGLRGFLGCKPVLFLSEIVQFFETALVQDNDITGAISGKYFTITPSRFAGVFELPTEEISNFSDVPKNQVCDARHIFSLSGAHVDTHGKKKFLKHEYRLLNVILAKSITMKAGSFDAVTNERFQMMTAIHFGLKVNSGKVLFSVLKEMVDRSVKKAKGFGAQISVLLNNDPVLSMGNATPFPASKILSPKVVLTYITANETADARGQSKEGGKSPVAVVKRASKSKKKLESSSDAPVEIVSETVGSKKRPAVGAVPLQMIEPTIAAPVEKPPASKLQSKRRILVLPTVSEDEDEEDAVERTVDKVSHVPAQVTPIMDDVDMIIGQVISESAGLSRNNTEQGYKHVDETDIGDDFDKWLDSSFPDFVSRVDEPVVASTNLEKAVSSTPNVEEADDSQSMDIQGTVDQTGGSTSKDVGEIVAPAANSKKSAEEHMSFDDILLQISNDMLLPSITAAEVTMIRLGEFSSIGDTGKAILVEDEQFTENPASEIVALICRDVEVLVRVRDSVMKAVVDFFASFGLNTMPDMESLKDLKEKEKLMMEWAETNTLATAVRRQIYLEPDQPWTDMAVQVISLLSAAHSQSLEDFKAQQHEHKIEMVQPNSSLPVIASIDRSGVSLAHFYSIAKSICWNTQMNDLKKGLLAPVGTIFQDLFDIKKNQRAQEAKLNALDGQVATIRNEQLEFQNKISADLLSLSTQFAEIVNYIHGGDAKKGEGGSSSRPPPVRVERAPLPTPQSPRDVAGGSSAVRIPTFPRTTGTFVERAEQAWRHILESGLAITLEEAAERVRQADIQESDRVQRERGREKRQHRSSSSKRRRGF